MNPKWIIQDIHQSDIRSLLDSLEKSGTEHRLVSTGTIYDSYLLSKNEICPDNSPKIFFGSINCCLEVQRRSNWIPGAYLNLDDYNCSYYYPFLYQWLLNQDHQFIPVGLLDKKKESLYNDFGVDRAIFIRPDKGSKSFTGQVLYKEKFDYELEFIKNYHLVSGSKHTMCVVARPYKVAEEFRFIVVDDKVITGSLYKDGADLGRLLVTDNEDSFKFAQSVVDSTEYRPDRVWCLDTCICGGDHYVLEVGGFSCAGIYACDCDKIVEAVNKIALEEYLEYKE